MESINLYIGLRGGIHAPEWALDWRPPILISIRYQSNLYHSLHAVKVSDIADSYTTELVVPADDCTFSDVPGSVAMFSLFIPSILRRFELAMVAQELNSTLLKPVGIRNLGLVQRAITHNSACEEEHYQRLEFLGDCILKLFTSAQLMVDHPNWHEGYLTLEKGRRVSNTTLEAITRGVGLDKFIITDPFTGAKWRPFYAHELLEHQLRPEVFRSSKMLADVVESVIGAAYLDDGLDASLRAISVFFPHDQWLSLERAARHLNSVATETGTMEPHLGGLEALLGYTFKSPRLLLEAMTHPSFQSHDLASTMSYPRMEFLGDAILDFLVVRRLFPHTSELRHDEMHTLRTAVVNEYILGYLCMTYSVPESRHNPKVDEATGAIIIEETTVPKYLWQYMRFSGETISDAQISAMDRLRQFSGPLKKGLESSTYPWAILTHFAPDKFFSDIIESSLGAMFIDSCGSLSACEGLLGELGLWKLLDQLVANQVDCLHPKNKLGKLADRHKVCYSEPRITNGKYFSTVEVGDRQVGEEASGRSRLAAEVEVADRACKILDSGDEAMQVPVVDDGVGGVVKGDLRHGSPKNRIDQPRLF